jgi:hypothetical protein
VCAPWPVRAPRHSGDAETACDVRGRPEATGAPRVEGQVLEYGTLKPLHDRELASGRNELNGVAAAQSQLNRCTPVRVHVCSNDCARPRAVPAVTTHSLTHSATLCGHCRAHVHCAAARAHGRARQAHEDACAPLGSTGCAARVHSSEWRHTAGPATRRHGPHAAAQQSTLRLFGL